MFLEPRHRAYVKLVTAQRTPIHGLLKLVSVNHLLPGNSW